MSCYITSYITCYIILHVILILHDWFQKIILNMNYSLSIILKIESYFGTHCRDCDFLYYTATISVSYGLPHLLMHVILTKAV